MDMTVKTNTTKIIPYSNGVLKRHNHHRVVVSGDVAYKECLRNHAASQGSHVLDGCGEFMSAENVVLDDPTSLKCAACGCHRNFHRREAAWVEVPGGGAEVIEYRPQHRHQPPPPLLPSPPEAVTVTATCRVQSPGCDEDSPPPISSTYYPGSAPHTMLALGSNAAGAPTQSPAFGSRHLASRKRFRTKFSQEQKEKMQEFSEKVGWKMLKTNEDLIIRFCNEIGVQRGVFKVWMHNNKNNMVKNRRSGVTNYVISANQGEIISVKNTNNNNNIIIEEDEEVVNGNGHCSSINNSVNVSPHQQSNGSTSSS